MSTGRDVLTGTIAVARCGHCDIDALPHFSRYHDPLPIPASVTTPGELLDVTCPFCGLACDDLVVRVKDGQLAVQANGCPLAVAGFGRPAASPAATPRLKGRSVSLAEAAAEAARILGGSRQPLVAGLGTDVEGARAAARLADRIGGVLDHMNSGAAIRNTLVLQDSGWVITTLSEIRNRADLFVAVGGDVLSRFPRFFERCLANRETLFGDAREVEVIFVGRGPAPGTTIPGITSRVIACDVSRLQEALGLMRALLAGRPVRATEAAGVPLSVWQDLADRMKGSRYGVAAWAAPDFDFPHAELTIQSLCELIKDLNRTTRFSGLALGGSEGDLTADSVALWQTGFGSRTSYGQGTPDHDGYHYGTGALLQGGADALLWISSFSVSRTPPATSIPTIVLGREGMTLEREAEVFIPVGTPGVDHAGHYFRVDRVVALPLRQLRDSALPSVAQALTAIEAALQERP
jgi:formylmethanofuran dehydrogenase subunit B